MEELFDLIDRYDREVRNGGDIRRLNADIEDAFFRRLVEIMAKNEQYETRYIKDVGIGSYFGNQFTLDLSGEEFGKYYYNYNKYILEVSYNKETLSVYTARHDGYWVPEYFKISFSDKPQRWPVFRDFVAWEMGIL